MKSFLKSKTLWVNLLFLALAFAQWYAQTVVMDVELQTLIIAAVNIVLRCLTNTGLELPAWFKRGKES